MISFPATGVRELTGGLTILPKVRSGAIVLKVEEERPQRDHVWF